STFVFSYDWRSGGGGKGGKSGGGGGGFARTHNRGNVTRKRNAGLALPQRLRFPDNSRFTSRPLPPDRPTRLHQEDVVPPCREQRRPIARNSRSPNAESANGDCVHATYNTERLHGVALCHRIPATTGGGF